MKRILLCAALLVVFAPGLLGQEAEFKRDLARAKEIAAQFARRTSSRRPPPTRRAFDKPRHSVPRSTRFRLRSTSSTWISR